MYYYKLIQAYELLALILSLHKDTLVSAEQVLKQLADSLENYYSDNRFTSIIKGIFDNPPDHLPIEDDLFIDFQKLDLIYTNLEILLARDRFILYLYIRGWINEFNIQFADQNLPARILLIDKKFVEIINDFFNRKVKTSTARGNNELMILEPATDLNDDLEGTWIESNVPKELADKGSFMVKGLHHQYKILYIDDFKIFIITSIDNEKAIVKNGEKTLHGWELVEPGDNVWIDNNINIDFYDLKRRYLKSRFGEKLSLRTTDLSYSYSPGKGISKFNLDIEGGTLMGVMGKEGTGKSTLLKLLAGEFLSSQGEVLINGYSLRKELYHLKGMIGFVPEEDLLFDELTVEENLYYAARLFLGKLSDKALRSKINQLLKDADLTGVRSKVVGKVREKNLQPGQRRLLNIALELIREPQILIVDNAVSPLSVVDTAKVIEVLSNYSFKGHIVVTSITQTDNKSIHYFDKVFILDEGGLPVFYGKLSDAWSTFLAVYKSKNKELLNEERTSIIQFISQPVYSLEGDSTERYKSPNELYTIYRENEVKEIPTAQQWKALPENILSTPSLDRQYMIFNLRNFKTKFARSRELIFTILLSPVLALLFSILMRGGNTQSYTFSENPYIPEFYFLSFLLAIFMGLVITANEIFREKNIIHKETYLNISLFSYINSKITYLFIIILIQSFFFVWISNAILQIRGMMLVHWITFFSCQSFGILLGLILSGSHKIIEYLYLRSIPLIIILQLIFGGGFIAFDTFPANKKNTPLISDLIVARWAYEAMMVYQFRENKYNKPIYRFDRKISAGRNYSYHVIPILRNQINYCIQNPGTQRDSMEIYSKTIKNTLENIKSYYDVFPYENIDQITPEDFNSDLADDLRDYLEYIDLFFYSLYDQNLLDKEEYFTTISDSLGEDYLANLKAKHSNDFVNLEVTKRETEQKIKMVGASLIMINDPIYQYPVSNFGRAQLFVPEKKISGQLVETVEFNISIIWLINLLLYILLIFDVFNLTGTRIRSVLKR